MMLWSTSTRTKRRRRRRRSGGLCPSSSFFRSSLLLFFGTILVSSTVSASYTGNHIKNSEDFYAILGVPKTASVKDIKKAYRRKTLETHPDKRPADVSEEEAAQKFHAVVQAYEVLTDEQSRKYYDKTGRVRDPNSPQGRGGGGGGFQWSSGGSFHFNFNFQR
jgi:preprotein translocase subunit Sec63